MSELITSSVITNAQTEIQRNAAVYGAATVQRIRQQSAVTDLLLRFDRDVTGSDAFTSATALAQELGRLAVGIIHAADPIVVIERGIALLTEHAGAIAEVREEAAATARKAKADEERERAHAEARRIVAERGAPGFIIGVANDAAPAAPIALAGE